MSVMTGTNGWVGKSGYRVAVVMGLLVLASIAAMVVYVGPAKTVSSRSTTNLTQATDVLVFGIVSTMGSGTHPVSMTFTSLRTSAVFVTNVSSGHFSVQLPNADSYNVSMRWCGNFTWQEGQVAAGSLTVNMTGGSDLGESYNVALPTPDSVVAVNGTIPWQVLTSSPMAVRFTASDGENFTALVSADHTFSLSLPNSMNYEIYIQSQNSTGYREWYYAHNLEVSAGINVIGLFVRVSL